MAERIDGGVIVALEAGISDRRRTLGWLPPDYGQAAVEIGLTRERISRILKDSGPETVHIFSGLGAYPGVYRAFRQCVKERRRVGLMAEASPAEGVRGLARTVVGRIRRLRFSSGVHFILGIGDGPEWFRRLGFATCRVFEFAYFPPLPLIDEEADERIWTRNSVRIVYLGMLVREKGIDALLNALSQIRSPDWQLALIGDGRDECEFKALAARLDSGERVTFCGSMPNPAAMRVLRGADMLVLPTLKDGWGAVVHEALSRGVVVICSDQCGARRVVLTDPALGSVYSSGESLKEALELWISKGHRTEDERRQVRAIVKPLAPEAGAGYFLRLMAHVYGDSPRPVAFWSRVSTESFQNARE